MKKARLATMWLDGCSGCHMSLLDIDEAIVAVAQQADIVYGPLVDAQEIPPDIDVAIVEGAVSSEDDLEKLRKMRRERPHSGGARRLRRHRQRPGDAQPAAR